MNTETANQAIAALYKHLENTRTKRSVTPTIAGDKKKTQLFDEDDYISLIIGVKKITREKTMKPKSIPVPHSIFNTGSEFCCFVKDPQADWKAKFTKEGIKIAKTIELTKLRNNYKTFDEKRKLVQSYDLFFVDDRIMPMVGPLIGKNFYSRKKQPIPVNFKKTDLKSQFAKAIKSVAFFETGGSCIAIKIAPTSFSQEEVHENLQAVIEWLVKYFPKGWQSIQSLSIKTTSSIALPLFSSLPVAPTKIEATKVELTKTSSKKPVVVKKTEAKKETKKQETKTKTESKAIIAKKNQKAEKPKVAVAGVQKPALKKNPAAIAPQKKKAPAAIAPQKKKAPATSNKK
eukprot:TRINITY_DN4551_c0_g1_i1.p1 TRINITY_DN4551_c0_g1~~TRINITY_DN4551_c0_g1_i1.p1  ORF type:complete len:345 (+),score=196.73 TRINITY_DN4551_c0_g1_i1:100-1134(+)